MNPWKEKNTYAERTNQGARRAQFAREKRETSVGFVGVASVALGCVIAAAALATGAAR